MDLTKRQKATFLETLQGMAKQPKYPPTVQMVPKAGGAYFAPLNPAARAFAAIVGRADGMIPADRLWAIEELGFVVEEPSGEVIPYQPRTASEMASARQS